MDKFVISLFCLISVFECCYSGKDSTVVKIIDGNKLYTTKLDQCRVTTDPSKFPELRGPKGDKGEKGYMGEKGEAGPGGEIGIEGRIGAKGDRGPMGPPGSRGNSGTCLHVCSEAPSDLSTGDDEGDADFEDPDEKKSGKSDTTTKIYNGLCNIKHDGKILKGVISVNPRDPFQVRCEEDTHRTCLIIKEYRINVDVIEKLAIDYTKENKSFWISGRTDAFIKNSYNISIKQMEWLQKRSSSVTQKIRYYCKNSYVADHPDTALLMIGWNDLLIGYYPDQSPMFYNWVNVNNCTSGANKEEWGYTDLLIKTQYPRRLPVIDIQIRDIRNEKQKFLIQPIDLCFG